MRVAEKCRHAVCDGGSDENELNGYVKFVTHIKNQWVRLECNMLYALHQGSANFGGRGPEEPPTNLQRAGQVNFT